MCKFSCFLDEQHPGVFRLPFYVNATLNLSTGARFSNFPKTNRAQEAISLVLTSCFFDLFSKSQKLKVFVKFEDLKSIRS